jgi:hypothetical protein
MESPANVGLSIKQDLRPDIFQAAKNYTNPVTPYRTGILVVNRTA